MDEHASVIVSHSEADTFIKCPRAHFYSYADGGLERKVVGNALYRGIFGHEVLSVFFKSLQDHNDFDKARKEASDYLMSVALQQDARLDMIAEVKKLVNLLWDTYRERIESWEILSVEQEYWLSVSETIRFPFKPDLVIREHGLITVVDHKFLFDFISPDMRKLLGQIPKYVGALRALDIDARRGLYLMLRHRHLKDESGPAIIHIEDVPLNNHRIVRSFQEQVHVTKQIARIKQLPVDQWDMEAVRSADVMKCSRMCSFTDLCITQLNGGSGKLMKEIDFKPNTYGYKEEYDG